MRLSVIRYCALFLLISLFAASCGYSSPRGTERIAEQAFRVNEGGTLRIESEMGSIEVTTHSKKAVEIEVYYKGREMDREELGDLFKVSFEQSGDDVDVFGRLEGSRRRIRNLHFRYLAKVPRKFNVDLNTAGGSISVDELTGRVEARTSGGSLHFGQITGPVTGKTSGGSISLLGCTGDADIRTSGGSIKIGEVHGKVDAHTSGGSISIQQARGEVKARTSGGSINVEEVAGTIDASTSGGSVTAYITEQPQKDCSLKTSGGSVVVYLAEDVGVDLDAKTSWGRVKTDFEVTVRGKIKKNILHAEINGGGPELYLRTSGGNIKVLKL